MCTYGFDGDLGLEEVDVLGEVERILATVANHVRVEDVVGSTEHTCQVRLISGAMQRTLQESHQQVDYLPSTTTLCCCSGRVVRVSDLRLKRLWVRLYHPMKSSQAMV